jgi:hypothetical protein
MRAHFDSSIEVLLRAVFRDSAIYGERDHKRQEEKN